MTSQTRLAQWVLDKLEAVELYLDLETRFLICCHEKCRHALCPKRSQITSHLRDEHGVAAETRNGVTSIIKGLARPGICDPTEGSPRKDGSPHHPKLRTYNGFACEGCLYRTTGRQAIIRHVSKDHLLLPQASKVRAAGHYRNVYLQSWLSGAQRAYWISTSPGPESGSIEPTSESKAIEDHLEAVFNREKSDLLHPTSSTYSNDGIGDSWSCSDVALKPWLNRTRWLEIYRKEHMELLSRMTSTPWAPKGFSAMALQLTDSITNLAEDEDKLLALVPVIDDMFDRCEDTFKKTGRSLLCWLRSTSPGRYYPKPMALVQDRSKKQYRRLFYRMIFFIFRAFRLRLHVLKGCAGIRIRKRIGTLLRAIWAHPVWQEAYNGEVKMDDDALSNSDESNNNSEVTEEESSELREEMDHSDEDEYQTDDNDGEYNEDRCDLAATQTQPQQRISGKAERPASLKGVIRQTPSYQDLIEQIFQLSIELVKEEYTDGQPSSTFLIYYSGILGWSQSSQCFLYASRYTGVLSILIYLQRLLLLEYALPLRGYKLLGIPRRPRQGQLEQLNTVRHRYMVSGSQSALEEMQSLRDFGRVVGRTDPPSFLLRWSDDGNTVYYGTHSGLSMETFRKLPEVLIADAEDLCRELMFDWQPEIDLLTIKDDLVNSEAGYSFVTDPRNKLQNGYRDLLRRACADGKHPLQHEGNWDWKAAFLYTKREETLRMKLLGALAVTCGQKPRSPELLGVLCENTATSQKNICLDGGCMFYNVSHHKAKRATNQEFIVARYLPARLALVLFRYLVFIRRLTELLYRERKRLDRSRLMGPIMHSPLLFRVTVEKDSKAWGPERLTEVLKRATTEAWGAPVTSQQLRQLCIGITEKHVREIHQPFNRFDDNTEKADVNVTFAWQSGHRPLQRAITYGLDGAFPRQLQPELLRRYKWVSTLWHEFLGLASSLRITTTSKNPRYNGNIASHDCGSSCDSSTEGFQREQRVAAVPHLGQSVPKLTWVASEYIAPRPEKRGYHELRRQEAFECQSNIIKRPRLDLPTGGSHTVSGIESEYNTSLNSQEVAAVTTKPLEQKEIYPFFYIPDLRVPICRECHFGVVGSETERHLSNPNHPPRSAQERQHITNLVRQLPDVILTQEELSRYQFPSPFGASIPYLQPARSDGLGCFLCDSVYIQKSKMQAHRREKHNCVDSRPRGRRPKSEIVANEPWRVGVRCQRLFRGRAASRWFEVDRER